MSMATNESEAEVRAATPVNGQPSAPESADPRDDAVGDAPLAGAGTDEWAGATGQVASSTDEVIISNDWARRRLELYGQVEQSMREGISQVLQTAAQIRVDVERDAAAYLRRLGGERARLEEAVASLERQRAVAEAGLERRRREIDAELETRRREQEDILEGQRRAAEEEVRALRLEAQEETRAVRQAVEEETRALREGAEAEVTRLRSETQGAIDQMVQEAEARRAQVAGEVRALEEQVAQIQGVIDSFLDNQLQTLRGSMGAGRGRPTPPPSPPPSAPRPAQPGIQSGNDAPGEDWGLAGLGSGFSQQPVPETATGGEDATPIVATDRARTSMVISGLPHFSRARALWQAIQEVPGVAEAKAINYQGGVLALEVQHEPALDLPASVTDLQGLRLRVTEAAPGHLRLTADA